MSNIKHFKSECSDQITETELGLKWLNKGIYTNRILRKLKEYKDPNVNNLIKALQIKLDSNVKCEFSRAEFEAFGLVTEIKYNNYVRVGSPARYFMPLGYIVSFKNVSSFSLNKTIATNKKPVLKTQNVPTLESRISCDSSRFGEQYIGMTQESFRFFEYWLIIYPNTPNAAPIQEVLLRSSTYKVNSSLTRGIELDRSNIKFKIVARGSLTTETRRYLNLDMKLTLIDEPRSVLNSKAVTIAT